MPLRKKTIMQGIFDRMARQQQLIRNGFEGCVTSGVPAVPFYLRIHDGLADDTIDHPNGDAIFEGATIVQADNLDRNYHSGTTLVSVFGSFMGSFNTYLSRVGRSGGLDSWLTDLDLNVHQDFNPIYRAINGQNLDAVNVFLDEPIDLATIVATGSGTGTASLGTPLGTGSGKFTDVAGSPNAAGAQLEAYVGSGAAFVNDMVINLTLKNENATEETNVLVTVPNTAAVGDAFDIGAGTDKRIEVLAIAFAGGNSGQAVGIRQKIERTISL